ncbi:hypothetical protein OPV22_002832 [Ensete ventricosum]|uniref:Uncharacterized protein n=1 Tax=Ensete ventricosum TaxID=4639 RepID=A0AAV8RZ22_ENSVE|nr:hypothetical protein OPV22_002832 [Ensete ventricosum]
MKRRPTNCIPNTLLVPCECQIKGRVWWTEVLDLTFKRVLYALEAYGSVASWLANHRVDEQSRSQSHQDCHQLNLHPKVTAIITTVFSPMEHPPPLLSCPSPVHPYGIR